MDDMTERLGKIEIIEDAKWGIFKPVGSHRAAAILKALTPADLATLAEEMGLAVVSMSHLAGWRELIAELDDLSKNEAVSKAMWAALDQIDNVQAAACVKPATEMFSEAALAAGVMALIDQGLDGPNGVGHSDAKACINAVLAAGRIKPGQDGGGDKRNIAEEMKDCYQYGATEPADDQG